MSRKGGAFETDFLRRAKGAAWTAQAGCCRYCFVPLTTATATADHVVPRAKGGTNAVKNIVACCAECNRAKGHMHVKSFTDAIKNPRDGMPTHLWMAWSRRRIWKSTHRATRNIRYAVGLENNTPIGRAAA